ncbi:hypothetical protein PINS_up012438 [Pythium insidiosum]|nr:hypothetical protein PINS_up012438 [Pythium insidiosum]
MEGYLIKRGHLVPSMRKRYCVLVRNVLTYYATHEDSRDPRVAALGSFRVEIVSDWHGRTTTQTYAHGLELETHDGKTFFCAALSADDKRQWMAAFQRALALSRQQQQQQATAAEEEEEEDEATRARRKALHARLSAFYETHNPSKLADLALLLACYRGRELAMLEAIDATYATQLATDDALLALLPPQDAHTLARQRLEYDGALRRAASDSDASWRHAQQLHVALRRLSLSFFATREGFKAGLALPTSSSSSASSSAAEHHASGSQSSVTVLAVKRLTPLRFAVETTEHAWMFFEAPNAVESAHWLEMLQSALDAELAASILQDEKQQQEKTRDDVSCRGYLTVKMDFMAALAAFRALAADDNKNNNNNSSSSSSATTSGLYASNAMVECFAELRNGDELVLLDAAQHDAAHEIATLTVLSTRPWTYEESASAITASYSFSKSKSTPEGAAASSSHRFPFQVLTQEQIVLSVCAATDVERARWIQRIRVAAERARAMELLAEQRDDVAHNSSEAAAEATDDRERHVVSSSSMERERRRGSVLDEASGHVRGYLLFAVGDARREDVREGFVVLDDRAGCRVFADEAAFLTRQPPLLEGQASELERHARLLTTTSVSPTAVASRVARLFSSSPKKSSSPSAEELSAEDEALAFRVTLGDALPQTLTLLPASHEERELWVAAFSHGLDLLQGEQLLRDEKLVLELEAAKTHETETETEKTRHHEPLRLVVPHAAMEGELTPWHSSLSLSLPLAGSREHAGPPFFAVLVGCHLRGFPSRDIAVEAAGSDVLAASPDLELLSVADWTPPQPTTTTAHDSSELRDEDGESCGFQVTAIRKMPTTSGTASSSAPPPTSSTWRLTAPSPTIKRQWVHAIKHELDFALAERYLDEEALEFARLAAQHLATTVSAAAGASGAGSASAAARIEGYVRVRHQSLGAMWRERFAVALGTTLFLFEQGSDALADDWTRRAVERHELLRAESWHAPPPALRSLTSSSTAQRQLHRHGLRLENQDGALLECTFATEDDRELWLKTLTTALEAAPPPSSLAASERLATRDVALPFVPGAAMEGYLHVRVRERERGLLSQLRSVTARWKTRYGVLLGVQLLLYATQEQAVALHGHNSQSHSQSADNQSETEATVDSQDALPQAVYEVLHAENWRAPEGKTASDPELETHAFVVAATKGSTSGSSSAGSHSAAAAVGDVLECKAHTSLERKRWLDAMEDQVARSREEQALVAHALQEHGDRERAKLSVKDKLQALQADASRASMVIQDVLNSFASTALSSESDDDSDTESDGDADAPQQGTGARRPTALPAPSTSWRRASLGLGRRSPENSPLYHSQKQQPLTEAEMEEHELRYVEFPASPLAKRAAASELSWWSALTGCCLGLRATEASTSETAMAMASIAPLHNAMYRYDCYHEDTPVWLPEQMDDV